MWVIHKLHVYAEEVSFVINAHEQPHDHAEEQEDDSNQKSPEVFQNFHSSVNFVHFGKD